MYNDEEEEQEKKKAANFEKGGLEQEQAEANARHQERQKALDGQQQKEQPRPEPSNDNNEPEQLNEHQPEAAPKISAVLPTEWPLFEQPEGFRLYEELREAQEAAINPEQTEPDEITRHLDEYNDRQRQTESEQNYRELTEGGDSSSASSRAQTPDEIRADKIAKANARLERLSEEHDSGSDNREMGEKARERSRTWE